MYYAYADATEPSALRDDLVVLPHNDPEAMARGFATNGYAVIGNGYSVLVDAVYADCMPGILALNGAGHKPVALVITHRHVIGQAETLVQLVLDHHIPVFLHPCDASHKEARRWTGMQFEDPTNNSLLAGCGLEVMHMPGHTEGHIMLYSSASGGMVITGDCAVGPTANQAQNGEWPVVRPPVFFSDDDAELRRGWQLFSRRITTLAPYRGAPLVNKPAEIGEALMSLRRAETTDLVQV